MFAQFYLGVLTLWSLVSHGTTLEAFNMCEQQKEIMFLLDTSSSVRVANFPKELAFVNSVIDLLDNDTLVGVYTFSKGYRKDIGLGDYSSKDDLMGKVSKIGYTQGQQTNTHLGIQYARAEFSSRDKVTKIIICVTDGEPTDPRKLKKEVNITRDMGIDIIAIGVGRNLREGLEITATQNSSEYIYAVDNFDNLASVVESLGIKPCTPIGPASPEDCLEKKIQIVFLLDRSLSVGADAFRILLNVTKSIVDFMDIGEGSTEIALITYASRVRTEFTFGTHTTKDEILEAVANVHFGSNQGQESVLDMALETVNNGLFAEDDPTAARVVITISDAFTQRWLRARELAETLKNRGVFMFAIGIGNVKEEELSFLATNVTALGPALQFAFLYNADYGNETLAETLLQNVAKVSCFY